VEGAGGVGDAGSLAGAGFLDIVPSLAVPIGGVAVSVPCVVGMPVDGVVVEVVDWATDAVPTSSAAAKASDFIDFTPLLRAGGRRLCTE
jgi:hypothetical protein